MTDLGGCLWKNLICKRRKRGKDKRRNYIKTGKNPNKILKTISSLKRGRADRTQIQNKYPCLGTYFVLAVLQMLETF